MLIHMLSLSYNPFDVYYMATDDPPIYGMWSHVKQEEVCNNNKSSVWQAHY